MVKKGDTLVEVTLAIGIFSMIAIAVASVMSGGSSSAQLALETTQAREEIDTQADAIRFIHSTYSANKDNQDHPYVKLWRDITKRSIVLSDNEDKLAAVLQYTPSSCSELYDKDSEVFKSAFVINPREFNKLSSNIGKTTFDKNLVLFTTTDNESSFTTASTHPRLVFGNKLTGENDNNAILADSTFPSNILYAEGIYVVPVVDPSTTSIVDVIDEEQTVKKPAYFDFYIRTCWYGSRTDDPSTISTVIRLHDPDAVFAGGFFDVKYDGYDPAFGDNGKIRDRNNIRKEELPTPTREGWTFTGWCDGTLSYDSEHDEAVCEGTVYKGTLTNPEKTHRVFDLNAMFNHTRYTIMYDLTGGSSDKIREYHQTEPTTTICYLDGDNHDWAKDCDVLNVDLASYPPDPRKMGGRFNGWCLEGTVDQQGRCIGGTVIPAGGILDNAELPRLTNNDPSKPIILKATWSKWNENYEVKLTWGAHPTDLDSHVRGQKSNNTVFHAYYSNKIGSDIDNTTIASLDYDDTTGYGPETFILNTLGGKNYYYYVRCYRDNNGWYYSSTYSCNVTGATVEVKRNGELVGTYRSDDASGTGTAWLVFANRNGKVTWCNTRTSDFFVESYNYNSTEVDRTFNRLCPEH
ncbi:hypothetical protein IJG12_03260 [Candidatus Saccharibacteria bacterium]|nr:hypothetical protein [Candidatus Saccharibacteria bacterium]